MKKQPNESCSCFTLRGPSRLIDRFDERRMRDGIRHRIWAILGLMRAYTRGQIKLDRNGEYVK